MRLIDADALEKEGWSLHRTIQVDKNTMEYQTKPLKQVPTIELQPQWIPCSERLPDGYVLFCDLDGDVYYGHRMENKWWAEGCDDRIKNVIAWMEKPKPYKEGES